MRYVVRAIAAALVVWVGVGFAPTTMAQDHPPAVIFEGLMDNFFGQDNGLVVFGTYDIAFAPVGQIDAIVGVVNSDGEVMAQFPFFPDYKIHEGVFGRIQVVGPADVQLTEPGIYTMVFVVDGEPITRFPFLLEQTGDGSDPFDPEKTYAFDGYWRTLAHITTGSVNDQPIPIFSIWLGGVDMPTPDTFQEYFAAELMRDGVLIAHAQKQTSSYSNGQFRRQEVTIYHPHEENQAHNAIAFTMADMSVDGSYELNISRQSDGAPLRSYRFSVSGGEIVPLPRTQLGFEPASDYIVPRVTRKGSTIYEFEEVIWIASE